MHGASGQTPFLVALFLIHGAYLVLSFSFLSLAISGCNCSLKRERTRKEIGGDQCFVVVIVACC